MVAVEEAVQIEEMVAAVVVVPVPALGLTLFPYNPHWRRSVNPEGYPPPVRFALEGIEDQEYCFDK